MTKTPKQKKAGKATSIPTAQQDLHALLSTQRAPQLEEYDFLKIADIDESPYNARRDYNKDELETLAQSIRENGLKQPIRVRRKDDGRWEVIAGHRRLRAHQLLGQTEIKGIISTEETEAGLRSASAVENLQRANLNPIEEGHAFQSMIDQGMTQEQVAQACGVSLTTVKRRVRLLKLPESIGRRIGKDGFSQEHAEVLIPFAEQPKMLDVAMKVANESKRYGGGMTDVRDFSYQVTYALKQAALVADTNDWQASQLVKSAGLEKKVKELPTMKVGDQNLVTDVAAWKSIVAEARAKAPKSRHDNGGNNASMKAHRARLELDNEVRKRVDDVERAMVVSQFKGILGMDKRVITTIAHVLADNANQGYGSSAEEILAHAAGVDEKTAKGMLNLTDAGRKQIATLLKDDATAARLLAGLALAAGMETYDPAWKHNRDLWVKKDRSDLEKKAREEIKAERKQAKKDKKAGKKTTGGARAATDAPADTENMEDDVEDEGEEDAVLAQ